MLAVLPRSGWICRGCCRKLSAIQIHRRFITSQIESDQKDSQAPRTRNIGIIAHIDAGKTTTTERMLYYSGFTRRIGDVDDGSTVTDFLPAERARGITIQSAAVSFHWPPLPQDRATPPPVLDRPRSMIPHSINLIDTPGHADFTFEVLRALRILDGAVCILDGVAGVEAQTEKVWHQASLYNIPKIVYVNKLDRDGAAFGRTIKDIGSRLGGWPALCQIPWWEGGKGQFTGVGDVVGLRALKWEHGEDGKLVKVSSLETLTGSDTKFAEEIKKARIALVEILSEHDDDMVERYLEHNEDHLAIPAPDIIKSLRKCISNGSGTIIPVFAGASFRNIGVQPLLDAIVDLLPEPSERKHVKFSIDGAKTTSTEGIMESLTSLITHREPMTSKISPKNQKALSSKQKVTGLMSNLEACALAFKVVNDPRRGVLVYVRVYSGSINRNASLFNTSLQLTERAPRLLRMYASDAVEISSIPAGQIGVVVGLKYARTGDTLISYTGMNSKHPPPAPFNSLQLRPIDVPPPVFFASIEPQSLSEEKHLSESLSILLREDPSLHLAVDDDSGQTLLSGMGELHLEIAKDRLVGDFKAKATMGKIEIGYRECILAPSPAPVYHMFERDVGGKTGQAGCTADVSPLDPFLPALPEEGPNIENNCVKISIPSYDATGAAFDNTTTPPLPPHLNVPLITKSLQNGALAALSRGPYYGYPLHGVRVAITFTAEDIFGTLTTPTALTSAARAATSSALNAASGSNGSGSGIMEPVMNVTISVDEGSMGAVIHDISSSRGGQVLSLDSNSEDGDQPDRIDISKIYAPPDPFASTNESNSTTSAHLSSSPIISSSVMRNVRARVPLKEMVGYLKHLRSLSKGRGTFVMEFERFERVTGVREKRILEEKGRGF